MLWIPTRANDLKFITNIEGFHGNIHKLGRLIRHVSLRTYTLIHAYLLQKGWGPSRERKHMHPNEIGHTLFLDFLNLTPFMKKFAMKFIRAPACARDYKIIYY